MSPNNSDENRSFALGEQVISACIDRYPLKVPFIIAHGVKESAEVITVTITEGECTGRGECTPYARYGESLQSVLNQIESLKKMGESLTREKLADNLPPGAARNALDCALWDLEAQKSTQPLWTLAELEPPQDYTTAFTLSIGPVDAVTDQALSQSDKPLLKIKCAGDGLDAARLQAIRKVRPDVRLIIDANESWTSETLAQNCEAMHAVGVEMIEQPLPADQDQCLLDYRNRPVPICADESCHTSADLAGLIGKYDMVNIKLDKTGGLTEAIALLQSAKAKGFLCMVGCMLGSELAIRPAELLTRYVEIVDLDAPLLLK